MPVVGVVDGKSKTQVFGSWVIRAVLPGYSLREDCLYVEVKRGVSPAGVGMTQARLWAHHPAVTVEYSSDGMSVSLDVAPWLRSGTWLSVDVVRLPAEMGGVTLAARRLWTTVIVVDGVEAANADD